MKNGFSIIITGSSGMLGHSLCKLLSDSNRVYSLARHPYKAGKIFSHKVDLTDERSTVNSVKNISPDLVIHAAALTDVDYCETHPEEAYTINVQATKNILRASEGSAKLFIYISSDFVFDGRVGNYDESAIPNPLNVYGETKLKGEELVLESGLRCLILRTSLYGWNVLPKCSIAEAIINSLREGKEFTPFIDQYFSPIFTYTLGKLLWGLVKKDQVGVFHVGTDRSISKYDFSILVARVFGLKTDLLRPSRCEGRKWVARRPQNVSLNNEKIKEALDLAPLNILDDLRNMKKMEREYDVFKEDR